MPPLTQTNQIETPRMFNSVQQPLGICFMNWLSTISSLVTREIKTRFAGGSLGHAWAIILPVSWILAITIFFRWLGRDAPIAVNLPIFLATGMLPYLIFRQIITSMMRSLKSNRHLITMGLAHPEDIFTATAALEVINAILVSGIVLALVAVMSGLPPIDAPLAAVWGMILAMGLGISVGRFAAVLALRSDSAMRLVPIVLRPFFWISGIFFVAAELPQTAINWLWFNPLLHVIEILRSGFFQGFDSDIATSAVPLISIAGFYAASRVIERKFATTAGRGMVPA